MKTKLRGRSGAATVEFALVAPTLFVLVLGLIVGGLGVFRYQQVAWLAREGTRFASVRGLRYEMATGETAATAETIRQYILSRSTSLDPERLTTTVRWTPDNTQEGQVEVTVSYRWTPEAYLGTINLTSTSRRKMSY